MADLPVHTHVAVVGAVVAVLGLVLAGCGSGSTSALGTEPAPSPSGSALTSPSEEVVTIGSAACAAMTLQEQVESAEIVVQGTFQPGPDFEGRLLSPASFEVDRYLKGTGGSEILAQTALARLEETGQLATSSGDVDPTAGQAWVLLGEFDAQEVLRTSRCAGSMPINELGEPEHQDEADRFLEDLEELVGGGSPPSD